MRTAQAVRQLRHQHADALAAQRRQVALLSALAAPEPLPRQWQLTVDVPNVVAFLTELTDADPQAAADANADAQQHKVRVRGLGLGRDVPRFLRWDQAVDVEALSLQELEREVAAVWRSRASSNAAHRSSRCSLQQFLAEHFWAQGEAAIAAAASAAVGSTASAEAIAAAAATAAYQFYLSLCEHHQAASAPMQHMWRVLTGQLPEADSC